MAVRRAFDIRDFSNLRWVNSYWIAVYYILGISIVR